MSHTGPPVSDPRPDRARGPSGGWTKGLPNWRRPLSGMDTAVCLFAVQNAGVYF